MQEFNLINLFKLIDQRNRAYLVASDLTEFTNSHRIEFSPLVKFYSREPNTLRFHEFCLIFRPLSRQLNETLDSRQ